MPTARIDLAKGKTKDYRAKVAEIVYRGIVEQLEAPEDDNYVIIHEHEPENFFWPKSFLGLDHTPDIIFIQVVTTVGAEVRSAPPCSTNSAVEPKR